MNKYFFMIVLGLIVGIVLVVSYFLLMRQPADKNGKLQGIHNQDIIVTSSATSVFPTPPSASTTNRPNLYPGLRWKPIKKRTIVVLPSDPEAPRNAEGFFIESYPVTFYPNDLLNYYTKELLVRGWRQTDVASKVIPPKGNSDIYGYEINEQYFTIQIDSNPEGNLFYVALEYN